ncbi:hypothetical protein PGTUg99_028102 [Puccinia graminis f. sp. tritici]|uniref:Uncharacterized protein n=1 Tax=Puccinia graminis f. sp. tritici TaxID=56615 RepID=A0A5B0SQE0_PUCGR|nr:hypothetical protein PGTUg99_028102 [Puccinia graminis f. sp. tritici]
MATGSPPLDPEIRMNHVETGIKSTQQITQGLTEPIAEITKQRSQHSDQAYVLFRLR